MKILGIDPGSSRIGYGLIETKPQPTAIAYGTIEAENHLEISRQFGELLKNSRPERIGIEKLFFARNRKTALRVAEARGILLLKIMKCGLPVIELSPMEIKQAVAGYGHADKKGIAKMVQIILNMESLKGYDDASDALAIAIAAASRIKLTP